MGLRPMEKTILLRGSTYEAGQTKDGGVCPGPVHLLSVGVVQQGRTDPQPGKHPHPGHSSGGFQPQDTCSPSWVPNSFYFKTFTCV